MELKQTVSLMLSSDYKERFIAEYLQVKIRFEKLKEMCLKWDAGKLEFTPTCSRRMYEDQLTYMMNYIQLLEERAKLEGVDLSEINNKVKEVLELSNIYTLFKWLYAELAQQPADYNLQQAKERFKEAGFWTREALKYQENTTE